MKGNVEGINCNGNAVITLVSLACDVLGSFVLILYAIYLLTSCVCFFIAKNILQILDGDIR